MTTTSLTDNYDTPWKEAVVRYFPEFMAFYFPQAHAGIDWSRPFTFLDQELAQVVQDAELGKRLVDRLVQVTTLQGDESWIYIHIEVQGQYDPNFAKRLFVYNYRIYDRYDRPVATLAVLADDSDTWQPKSFGYEIFGCRHYLEFPSVKLVHYASQLDDLLKQPNPFALVTSAHLQNRSTKGNNHQRYDAKLRLAKLLYERNWDKQRILDLYAVIDWMMTLPRELEYQLQTEIDTFERNKKVSYITNAERFGIEKGMQQGMQQGKLEGKLEGQAALLTRLLNKRFGFLSIETSQRLQMATSEQLDLWADRILDAPSLAAVFDVH